MDNINHQLNDYCIMEVGTKATGVIVSLGKTEIMKGKFGDRKVLWLNVEVSGSMHNIPIGLPERAMLSQKSNLFKLLRKVKVKNIQELIGKQVELVANEKNYLNFVL